MTFKAVLEKKNNLKSKLKFFFFFFLSPLGNKNSFQKVKICTIYSLSDNVKH